MRKIVAVIALFLLLVLSSCSSKQESVSENTLNVNIENFAFSPNIIKIKTGDTVTWTNKDDVPHTVTSISRVSCEPPTLCMDRNLFVSGPLDKDQTYQFTFLQPGTYEYTCDFHTSMKGNVIVE
ncbi:MAG: cupredoxin domain-containing protein [Nanoarchaeota archaeon]